MMSMRRFALIVLALILSTYPVYAGYATAIPGTVQIPIGSSSNVTLIINLTTSDYIGYLHQVEVLVVNQSTNQPSDKLNVSVQSGSISYYFSKQTTGIYWIYFKPSVAGNYTFNLTLSTNNTNLPNIGDKFSIGVQDEVTQNVNTPIGVIPLITVVSATIFSSEIIPELSTLALSAVGLVALGLIIMRRK